MLRVPSGSHAVKCPRCGVVTNLQWEGDLCVSAEKAEGGGTDTVKVLCPNAMCGNGQTVLMVPRSAAYFKCVKCNNTAKTELCQM